MAEGIDPATPLIPIARLGGVTTAVTGPSNGLVPGQSVLIDLAGDRIETLVARSPVAMVINLNESSKGAGGGSRAGTLEALRQLLNDALEYQQRKGDFKRNQMQALSAPAAELEALGPVLRGELPVVVIRQPAKRHRQRVAAFQRVPPAPADPGWYRGLEAGTRPRSRQGPRDPQPDQQYSELRRARGAV